MSWESILPPHLQLPSVVAHKLEEFRSSIGCPDDAFAMRIIGSNWATRRTQKLTYNKARSENLDASEAELVETAANIARVEADIAETKRQIKRQSRAFRPVIPVEGPNGTLRIPICVECRADTVVIQPEGIVLTEADFDGPMGPG